MTKLTPYFYSETSLKEFETEFKGELPSQLLRLINNRLAEGVMLPLGVDNQENKLLSKITIFKDYVVIF